MYYRLNEFLNSLEHYELVKLKQELEKGTISVAKVLQEKIRELEKKHAGCCTTCSNTLDPYNTNNLMTSEKKPRFAVWTA